MKGKKLLCKENSFDFDFLPLRINFFQTLSRFLKLKKAFKKSSQKIDIGSFSKKRQFEIFGRFLFKPKT